MSKVVNSLNDPKLIKLINSGSVGVLPTDTVYGIVCSASDQAAVKRLYKFKNRENKPGTIIAANIQQLIDLGIKARYLKAIQDFWPNPLSIIIPTGLDLQYLHLGKQSLALRIPKDKDLQKLLIKSGPLLTTSANSPGSQPAANLAEAQNYFGEQMDFYVADGDMTNKLPSTIIKVVDDAIEIVRQGAFKIDV